VEGFGDKGLYLRRQLSILHRNQVTLKISDLFNMNLISQYIIGCKRFSSTQPVGTVLIQATGVIMALGTGPSIRGISVSPVLSFSCHRSISSQAHIIIVFNCNTSSFFPPLLAASRLFAPIKSKHFGIQCGDTKSHAILIQDVKLRTYHE
jgi:hypothetical protein